MSHTAIRMELWGYCTPCQRWFYIQTRETATITHECPVCAASASLLRDDEAAKG